MKLKTERSKEIKYEVRIILPYLQLQTVYLVFKENSTTRNPEFLTVTSTEFHRRVTGPRRVTSPPQQFIFITFNGDSKKSAIKQSGPGGPAARRTVRHPISRARSSRG
eukprot:751400-Hanusia_phi.AAC.1